MEVTVWVVPGSSRRVIGPIREGALRVRVTAVPEGGRANREAAEVVARALGARRGEVVAGARGRRKRVLVMGIDTAAAEDRLTGFAERSTPV